MEIRKTGVGGSEVASVLGLSEYGSPYSVWYSKVYPEQLEQYDNKFMKAGRFLESAVSDFFADESGYRVIKSSANSPTIRHPEHSFALATPDRKFFARDGRGKGILECKTTQKSLDEPEMSWFVQLQWYLGVTGSKYGAIAWLERGLDFKYQEYEFDEPFWEFALESVRTFWEDYVLKKVEPNPINPEDVERMYAKHIDGKVVTATTQIAELHRELKLTREAIGDLEKMKAEYTGHVQMFMLDAESVIDNGGNVLFTWKSGAKGSRRFLIK